MRHTRISLTLSASFALLATSLSIPQVQPDLLQLQRSGRVRQISVGKKARVPPHVELAQIYRKHGMEVPTEVQIAAHNEQLSLATLSSSSVDAGTTGSVQVQPEEADDLYLAPVSIGGLNGGQAQTFNIDLDTGSPDLWVISSSSSDSSGHTTYPNSGVNTGGQLSISYVDGSSSSGPVYNDTVAISAISATVPLGSISNAPQGLTQAGADGLMGLSPAKPNYSGVTDVSWIQAVMGSLPQALFTLSLKKDAPGEYDFGFIDSSKYSGSILYAPLITGNYWSFQIDGYSFGGNSTAPTTSSQTVFLDSGTTYLVVDTQTAQSYYQNVQGVTQESGYYYVPCTATLPEFSIVIGGQKRTVPSNLLLRPQQSGQDTCGGGIQGMDLSGTGNQWILGDIFLKSQYAVFDMGNSRIGLAYQAGVMPKH